MPRESPRPPAFEPAALQRSLDRYLTVGLVFMAVLVAGFVAYRIREPGLRRAAAASQARSYTAIGTDLFAKNCQTCHGAGANGGSAPTLNAKEFLSATTDDEIAVIVRGGVPGSDMSAWGLDFGGALTDQQISQLVAFLRSLAPTAPSKPDWRRGSSSGSTTTSAAGGG